MDDLVSHVANDWDAVVTTHIGQLKKSCLGGGSSNSSSSLTKESAKKLITSALPSALSSEDLLRSIAVSARLYTPSSLGGGGGGGSSSSTTATTPSSIAVMRVKGQMPSVYTDTVDNFGAFSLFPPHVHEAWLSSSTCSNAAGTHQDKGIPPSPSTLTQTAFSFSLSDLRDTIKVFLSCPSIYNASGFKEELQAASRQQTAGLGGALATSVSMTSIVSSSSQQGVTSSSQLASNVNNNLYSNSNSSSAMLPAGSSPSSPLSGALSPTVPPVVVPPPPPSFYNVPPNANERMVSYEAAMAAACGGVALTSSSTTQSSFIGGSGSGGVSSLADTRLGIIRRNEDRLRQYVNTLLAMRALRDGEEGEDDDASGDQNKKKRGANDNDSDGEYDVLGLGGGGVAARNLLKGHSTSTNAVKKTIFSSEEEGGKRPLGRFCRHRLPLPAHLSCAGFGPSHRQCFYAVLLRLGVSFPRLDEDDDEGNDEMDRRRGGGGGGLAGPKHTGTPLSDRLSFAQGTVPAATSVVAAATATVGSQPMSPPSSNNGGFSSTSTTLASSCGGGLVGYVSSTANAIGFNKPLPQRVIDELVPSLEACDTSGTTSSGARKMLLMCASSTVGDDDRYFVFLDEAKITLCAMLEDVELLPALRVPCVTSQQTQKDAAADGAETAEEGSAVGLGSVAVSRPGTDSYAAFIEAVVGNRVREDKYHHTHLTPISNSSTSYYQCKDEEVCAVADAACSPSGVNTILRRVYGLPTASAKVLAKSQQHASQSSLPPAVVTGAAGGESAPVRSSSSSWSTQATSTVTPEIFTSSICFAIAPIFFITTDMPTAYYLAKGMYQQLWRFLQKPSPQLIHMCCLFEHLTVTLVPECVLHMYTPHIATSPLALCFKWMATGFAETLPTAEVLAVWDRLVAFMGVASAEGRRMERAGRAAEKEREGQLKAQPQQSAGSKCQPATSSLFGFGLGIVHHNAATLLPYSWLAFVAASLLILRAPLVQKCKTKQEVAACLWDYSSVKIIPIVAKTLKTYVEVCGGKGSSSAAPPSTQSPSPTVTGGASLPSDEEFIIYSPPAAAAGSTKAPASPYSSSSSRRRGVGGADSNAKSSVGGTKGLIGTKGQRYVGEEDEEEE